MKIDNLRRQSQNENYPKTEVNLINEQHKNEDDPKEEDHIKMKMNLKMQTCSLNLFNPSFSCWYKIKV